MKPILQKTLEACASQKLGLDESTPMICWALGIRISDVAKQCGLTVPALLKQLAKPRIPNHQLRRQLIGIMGFDLWLYAPEPLEACEWSESDMISLALMHRMIKVPSKFSFELILSLLGLSKSDIKKEIGISSYRLERALIGQNALTQQESNSMRSMTSFHLTKESVIWDSEFNRCTEKCLALFKFHGELSIPMHRTLTLLMKWCGLTTTAVATALHLKESEVLSIIQGKKKASLEIERFFWEQTGVNPWSTSPCR